MAFIAPDPHACVGEVVADGHCMRHVQVVAGVTHSSTLRRGASAQTVEMERGTVIATFNDEGGYANATDGSSHIAIFLDRGPDGELTVVDQWLGKPVGERVIRNKNGEGPACDDASRYYVAEADV